MALRYDTGQLGQVERLPQGGIRVPAFLTRTGIFRYTAADGTVRRELRHPDEVFATDSIAGLRDAPVTDGHRGLVTAENFSGLAAGHVSGEARRDGDRIRADVVIQDSALLAKIMRASADGAKVREVSCGYTCDCEDAPGEHEGEHYDCVQRNIRYNHVAIVARGRAGPEIRLHLDAKGNQINDDRAQRAQRRAMKFSERIAELETRIDELEDAATTADADVAKEKARADAAEGARDAAVAERDALKARLGAAEAPAALDARVTARLALVAAATKVLGPAKFDGLTDRQVKEAVVKHGKDAALDLSKRSDEYVDAAYDTTVRFAQDSALSAAGAHAGGGTAGGTGIMAKTAQPGDWTPPPAQPWTQPLSRSRKDCSTNSPMTPRKGQR